MGNYMCKECLEIMDAFILNGTSKNTTSTHDQQILTRELVKSPVHAKQLVQTTAVITKSVIGDNHAGDSKVIIMVMKPSNYRQPY